MLLRFLVSLRPIGTSVHPPRRGLPPAHPPVSKCQPIQERTGVSRRPLRPRLRLVYGGHRPEGDRGGGWHTARPDRRVVGLAGGRRRWRYYIEGILFDTFLKGGITRGYKCDECSPETVSERHCFLGHKFLSLSDNLCPRKQCLSNTVSGKHSSHLYPRVIFPIRICPLTQIPFIKRQF